MSACIFCDLLKDEKSVLYEDALVAVMFAPKPAIPGHLIVVPKNHTAIMEELPDDVLGHCFNVANKTSILVFEGLGAAGTNVIVQNGIPAGQSVPHFCISVLPRQENDTLNLKWAPKKIPEPKMNEVQTNLKDECDYIGPPVQEKKPEPVKKEEKKIEYKEDNYLLKQLKRIP